LDRFLGGGRGWTSIRARNKQGGWSFIRGGLDRLRFYIHDADTQERRGYGGIHPSEVPRLSSLRPSTGLAAVPSAANLTCAVAPSIPEPRRHLGMPPSLPPPSRWPRRAPAAKLRPSEPSASGAPPSWGAHLETLTHGAGVEVSGPSPAGGGDRGQPSEGGRRWVVVGGDGGGNGVGGAAAGEGGRQQAPTLGSDYGRVSWPEATIAGDLPTTLTAEHNQMGIIGGTAREQEGQ